MVSVMVTERCGEGDIIGEEAVLCVRSEEMTKIGVNRRWMVAGRGSG